ncbi:MAG: hypothetical protein K6B14_10500 [Lachnospiraceae bacterium]|nr:hypothetical protein [Lachnospiraceae bacterium]
MTDSIKKTVRMIILVFAIGFIVAGIFDGGYRDTFIKAVMVCMECIGIG